MKVRITVVAIESRPRLPHERETHRPQSRLGNSSEFTAVLAAAAFGSLMEGAARRAGPVAKGADTQLTLHLLYRSVRAVACVGGSLSPSQSPRRVAVAVVAIVSGGCCQPRRPHHHRHRQAPSPPPSPPPPTPVTVVVATTTTALPHRNRHDRSVTVTSATTTATA